MRINIFKAAELRFRKAQDEFTKKNPIEKWLHLRNFGISLLKIAACHVFDPQFRPSFLTLLSGLTFFDYVSFMIYTFYYYKGNLLRPLQATCAFGGAYQVSSFSQHSVCSEFDWPLARFIERGFLLLYGTSLVISSIPKVDFFRGRLYLQSIYTITRICWNLWSFHSRFVLERHLDDTTVIQFYVDIFLRTLVYVHLETWILFAHADHSTIYWSRYWQRVLHKFPSSNRHHVRWLSWRYWIWISQLFHKKQYLGSVWIHTLLAGAVRQKFETQPKDNRCNENGIQQRPSQNYWFRYVLLGKKIDLIGC